MAREYRHLGVFSDLVTAAQERGRFPPDSPDPAEVRRHVRQILEVTGRYSWSARDGRFGTAASVTSRATPKTAHPTAR